MVAPYLVSICRGTGGPQIKSRLSLSSFPGKVNQEPVRKGRAGIAVGTEGVGQRRACILPHPASPGAPSQRGPLRAAALKSLPLRGRWHGGAVTEGEPRPPPRLVQRTAVGAGPRPARRRSGPPGRRALRGCVGRDRAVTCILPQSPSATASLPPLSLRDISP